MPAKSTSTEINKQDPTPVSSAPKLANRELTHVLLNENGLSVEIGRHVVAKIVGLAVREVPGVHEVVPHGASDRLAFLTEKVTGGDHSEVGVHVEIGTTECAAEVHIVCDYGANIPVVAGKIRDIAAARIREMTGLILRDVGLHIEDLYFADEPRRTGRELR